MSIINRVATANMYDNSIRNIGGRQSSLAEQSEKLTAGKRVLRASDDPVAAAQAERAITRMERIKTEQRALDVQRNAVAQAESSIGDAVNLVQNIRELMVSAGAGTLAPQDRRIIAGQIEGLRDQLINVANRKDTNGLPLLGALGSALAPFLGNTPDSFAGLAGQSSGSAVGIPSMLDGDSAFMFQTKRDGVYHAGLSNTDTPPTSLTGRKFGTTEITVVDPTKLTTDATGKGDEYKIEFTVTAGAAPNTSSATYTITNTSNGALPVQSGTIPDFPNDKPLEFEISKENSPTGFIDGLKFSIQASPVVASNGSSTPGLANLDTITLKPSTGMFGTIDDAISGIANSADSNAAAQAVGQGLANLDRGMERLQSVRSYAGELLNRADRITGNQDARNIQLEGDRSRAEDIDLIKGLSDFESTKLGYQAALQTYAMVQKMSLFNYIS